MINEEFFASTSRASEPKLLTNLPAFFAAPRDKGRSIPDEGFCHVEMDEIAMGYLIFYGKPWIKFLWDIFYG